MNFKKQLMADNSRANTDLVVYAIGGDPENFHEFFQLLHDPNGHVANKAAWVIEKCAATYPWLIKPYLEEIIEMLKNTRLGGMRRLLLKVMTLHPVPENRAGELVDLCFTWIENPKEKVAVKVYSMTILSDFCEKEPDIAPELVAVLEKYYQENSMAFKSRANKIFKKFR